MNATTNTRLTTYAWIILSAMTVISWWLGPERAVGVADPSVPITLAVLVMAFIKVRLVIRYFMEVRTAPPWLRLFTDGWLVIFWGAVLAICLY